MIPPRAEKDCKNLMFFASSRDAFSVISQKTSQNVTIFSLKDNSFHGFPISGESDPPKVPRNDSPEQGFGPRETGNRKSAKHTYSLSFFKVSGGPDSREIRKS